MIVPRYWAEARIQRRVDGRSFTVRRWGWSDVSEEGAQQHADSRAKAAIEDVVSGRDKHRTELKRAYNGAEGVPIREEIVAIDGEIRVTRNGYGALCLNTPNVLFADIDLPTGPPVGMVAWTLLGLWVMFMASKGFQDLGMAAGATILCVVLMYPLAYFRWKVMRTFFGSEEQLSRSRIQRFVSSRPDWHVRVYRTPAGFRVLAMHRVFDPRESEVQECFAALKTDRMYARMCRRQHCFRARVTPKPWRIGIADHMPTRAVWPLLPETLAKRNAWIERYDKEAREFAACRFELEMGSSTIHPEAARVEGLHDALSRAAEELPLG